MLDILKLVFDPLLEAVTGRRRLRLLVHQAYFSGNRAPYYFLNLTNLSQERELEVTHVYFDVDPQVHAIPSSRPLPKRLKPDETWETWVAAAELPAGLGDEVFALGRARLSTGQIIKSRKNKTVPEQGSVPGGPIWPPPG